MPVINFSYSDLCDLMGFEMPRSEIRERLPMMGADLRYADDGSDEMSFEFFPDRPDLFSVEGIARAMRAFTGREPGLRTYAIDESTIQLTVDSSVDEVRPYIWSALVEGNEIDDSLIKSMMDVQEKLHLTVGRNRKKVAIGIHDVQGVKPPFVYKAVRPEEVSFVPLQGARRMNLAEILADHDKGRAYAFVLKDKSRYPIITDCEGEVLSFPPVINGIATTVTEETRDIFVDCTGTDLNAVKSAVNILTTALAERGGKIRTVEVKLQDGSSCRAPDLTPRRSLLDPDFVNRWIGTNLEPPQMAACLMRMGHGAKPCDAGVEVLIPAYRADVIHPVDLAEDVAIGYGFDKFGTQLPRLATFGVEDDLTAFSELIRPIMIGLGYLELVTLSLSNPGEQYEAMGLSPREDAVAIKNPVSEDHVMVRTSLLPSLLAVLRRNKHRELPQKVFEIGDVVVGARNKTFLTAISVHAKAGFTECKSDMISLMQALGIQQEVAKKDIPSFVPGRCAEVSSSQGALGVIGELSPATLTAFELGYPATAMEFDLETLRRSGPRSSQ